MSFLRTLLALMCLLIFSAQWYVAATHIHGMPDSVAAHRLAVTTDHSSPDPLDQDDPAHCPFCQIVLLAGVAVGTAPIALMMPSVMTDCVAPLSYLACFHSRFVGPSHNRGPPRS